MENMHKLKNLLCEELDEITMKGNLSAGDLEAVHKLTDTIKNIYKIEMLKENSNSNRGSYDDGGSYRGGSYRGSYDSAYDEGYAGRRGRDSMGRYSSDNGLFMERIRKMTEDQNIPSEERMAIRRVMERLQT